MLSSLLESSQSLSTGSDREWKESHRKKHQTQASRYTSDFTQDARNSLCVHPGHVSLKERRGMKVNSVWNTKFFILARTRRARSSSGPILDVNQETEAAKRHVWGRAGPPSEQQQQNKKRKLPKKLDKLQHHLITVSVSDKGWANETERGNWTGCRMSDCCEGCARGWSVELRAWMEISTRVMGSITYKRW